jgi:hypothetical protein
MSPQRYATLGAFGGTVVLAGWVAAGLAGFGSPGIENTDRAPIEERRATPLTVDAEPASALRATTIINKTSVPSAAVAATEPGQRGPAVVSAAVPVTVADTAIVGAASPGPSPMPPPENPEDLVQVATVSTPDPVQSDVLGAVRSSETLGSLETLDECLVADTCIDQYLWSAYQRTPKLDTIKVSEKKKVTVKKNGKTRTVVKTVTKLVDEDFTWKDPKAAEKAGMSMMDYVIGGMDRSFKIKLYHALRAMDEAGLAPGITSAFRDDYRQSIASGLKAASNGSYHGGSLRGGYGHGLAADLVSVKGATRAERYVSSESLWKWIDAHGKEYGVGRPYLDKDPPHVAPIDGKEYAGHHRAAKSQLAKSDMKRRNRLAHDDHGVAKRAKAARSSRVSSI